MTPSATPPAGTPLPELAALTDRAWLVGGAVRDELLGRPSTDFDLAVDGDAKGLARALGRVTGASSFALSDAFGAWRVTAPDRAWQVDLTPLTGASLQDDLANRDLTVNAIARPLTGGGLIDPFGGAEDLGARRLAMVSPQAFSADPLRVIRLARISAELGFAIDPGTGAAARKAAPALSRVAGERSFAELKQIVAAPEPLAGLATLESVGATDVVLPELMALRGVEQNVYHHLDVYGHTLEALEHAVALERDPAAVLGVEAAPVVQFLDLGLADEMTRGEVLRWAALLHDIAKPQTRAVTAEGRVTFMGHDVEGAAVVRGIFSRLRAAEKVSAQVAALTRHHLRLGFLVHARPLSPRDVYGYLATCEPVSADVTLLSCADRLATRGRNGEAAIAAHLELAREIWPAALAWQRQRPRPPVRGDDLAAALGRPAGPWLAGALEELSAARYAGEIDDSFAQSLGHTRGWLDDVNVPD
jgi:poly(A) polymerase